MLLWPTKVIDNKTGEQLVGTGWHFVSVAVPCRKVSDGIDASIKDSDRRPDGQLVGKLPEPGSLELLPSLLSDEAAAWRIAKLPSAMYRHEGDAQQASGCCPSADPGPSVRFLVRVGTVTC